MEAIPRADCIRRAWCGREVLFPTTSTSGLLRGRARPHRPLDDGPVPGVAAMAEPRSRDGPTVSPCCAPRARGIHLATEIKQKLVPLLSLLYLRYKGFRLSVALRLLQAAKEPHACSRMPPRTEAGALP